MSAKAFRALWDSNLVGIAISDSERVVDANDFLLAVLGYRREELEAGLVSLQKLTPPEWQPQTQRAKEQLLEQGVRQLSPFEKQYFRKDGSRVPVLAGGILLEREPPRFLGVLVDLSERKRAEAELDRFFNLALEGLCIAGLDGYFRRINPAFERALGYTREELCAEPFVSFVHPDDREATLAAVEKLSQGVDVVSFENRYRCQDGSYRWLHWNSAAEPAEGLIFATVSDVTERRRWEQDLQESRDRLDLAQKAGNVGVFDWDMRTGAVVWTEQLVRMFGLSRGSFGGDYASWRERVHPDDLERVETEVRQAIDKRAEWVSEYRIVQPGGAVRWIDGRGRVLEDDGTPVRFIGVNIDATERKEAEAAQQEAQALLDMLIESAPVGRVFYDLDLRIRLLNPRLAEINGFIVEDCLGRRPSECLPCLGEEIEGWVGQVLESGEPLLDFEVEQPRPDGTVRQTLRSYWPVRREDGELLGVGAVVEDISERKRMEEALRSSEARFRSVFENSVDAVLLTTPDGGIVSANPAACRLFGRSEAELCARGRAGVVDTSDARLVPALAERSARGWLQTELRFVRADGSMFEGEITSSVFEDADGARKTSMIIRDVSQRKEADAALRAAQEEAERASRAKSDFLSQMSHELRTPLNAVLGFAQLLQLEELPPGAAESVGRILAGGEHLLELINELLDIERIESGRLSISLEPVAVFELVSEALELMAPLAASRESEFVNAVPHEAGLHVQADRARLRQVLLNLVTNALKYGPAGNVVRVSAEPVGERALRIGVRDQGPGISAADRERVFDPFERLVRDVEGTGLGLALCKGLVEAMGGAIGLESTLGEGSLFWVELPLVESPLETHEATGGERLVAEPPAGAPGSRTVLYVEDNLSNLRLVEAVLARRPALRLLSAMQGQLGLELAAEHTPDLILLDLHLPDIPGEELLRRLQADERTRTIPIVVISADATERQIKRLLAMGARDYLTKPLEVKRLLAIIDSLARV